MQTFEYKIVPAPRRGKSGKGIRGNEAKFANALSVVMNELGAAGWEYIRTDTLPAEERRGLVFRSTVQHTMLIFRRPKQAAAPVTHPLLARPKREQTPPDASESADQIDEGAESTS